MSLFSAQVFPGQGLGFIVLGSTLHNVLTRLKAEPRKFPKIDLIFNQSSPLKEPVILGLPDNGLRLRFDGPEQRLRLIEVLDFAKSHLKYKDKDLVRFSALNQSGPIQNGGQSAPSFRHIYNRLLGPTFPGEYVEPITEDKTDVGTYVLSYPGIAFSFPLQKSNWSPEKDFVSLLSSATSQYASSMAIFHGKSWSDCRDSLFTSHIDIRDLFSVSSKDREQLRDEVKLIRIYGEGQIELLRSEGIPAFWINLGLTSPQDLILNLGPPDAIFRKNDHRMSIHKCPVAVSGRIRKNVVRIPDDSTDTDQSSAFTVTDDSESDESASEVVESVTGECFYNYFYQGFDILLSYSVVPSPRPPSKIHDTLKNSCENIIPTDLSNRLVATKLILHGNAPGSYTFNRHRRCRWEIKYLEPKFGQDIIHSESPFHEIEKRLQEEWKSMYRNSEEERAYQRGMVLNRDWGDSLGSSCELLGGREEYINYKKTDPPDADDIKGLGNTNLYGFPGLVFEVMKNGFVSGLTIF
ncbi:putative upf0183 domain containing protein [Erysiphe necator]|uniref:Putative upf0183 domain containing protein n=1 Tax=Uncinula necator TaxID=52586 RepID=A0A0B1P6L8_UNCNE|nr:putative upf0183 domain containing protein [Erysiphe necator]